MARPGWHRHWKTGEPCNCGFVTHLPEEDWTEENPADPFQDLKGIQSHFSREPESELSNDYPEHGDLQGFLIEKSASLKTGGPETLKWSPGQPGKGFVTEQGGVWTWPVDPDNERRPWHMQKSMEVKGAGDRVLPGSPLHIEPDGYAWIFDWGKRRPVPEEFREPLQQAHPELHFEQQEPAEGFSEDFGLNEEIPEDVPPGAVKRRIRFGRTLPEHRWLWGQ